MGSLSRAVFFILVLTVPSAGKRADIEGEVKGVEQHVFKDWKVTLEEVAQDSQVVSTNTSEIAMSPALLAVTSKVPTRQCVIRIAKRYTERLGKSDAFFESAMKLAVGAHEKKVADLRILEGGGIDDYDECSAGDKLIECAPKLSFEDWIEVVFSLEDIIEAHKNHWTKKFCFMCSNEDKKIAEDKQELFKAAIEETGFILSAAEDYCTEIGDKPDTEEQRLCMRDKLATDEAWQDKNVKELADFMEKLWATNDIFEMVDKSTGTHGGMIFEHGLTSHTSCQSKDAPLRLAHIEYDEMKKNMPVRYEKGWISNKRIELEDDLLSKCADVAAGGALAKNLQRNVEELTTVCNSGDGTKKACNAQCTEKSPTKFCPEGHACNCKRPETPQRAKKAFIAGTVIGGGGIDIVAGLIGFCIGGPAGAMALIGTVKILPDMTYGVIASAALSRKWTPECQCYQAKCVRDKAAGQCVMEIDKGARASSNPFALYPPGGMKCVMRANDCKLQPCDRDDVKVAGPTAPKLFGKVGRKGEDLYNCPSMKGGIDSQLTYQEEVPASHGNGMIKNNANNRAELLKLWGPVAL